MEKQLKNFYLQSNFPRPLRGGGGGTQAGRVITCNNTFTPVLTRVSRSLQARGSERSSVEWENTPVALPPPNSGTGSNRERFTLTSRWRVLVFTEASGFSHPDRADVRMF